MSLHVNFDDLSLTPNFHESDGFADRKYSAVAVKTSWDWRWDLHSGWIRSPAILSLERL